MFEGLFRDFRFGLRIMLKNPGFSILAVLAVALGIGSVTTMFSVINGAIWKGLPFEEPEEIVYLVRYNENRDPWDRGIPYEDFGYIADQQTSFEGLAGYFGGTINLAHKDQPRRYTGSRISHNFLELLGAQPLLGRGFLPEEDQVGAPPVVLLGYGVWRGQFGGDPGVINQTVRVNGALATVVGVMPEGFAFPTDDDLWVPLNSAQNWDDPQLATRYSLNAFARLADGVNRERAEAELSGLISQLAEAHPARNERYKTGGVLPFASAVLGNATSMMWFMTIMAGFVLLIACTNVANLLLARSTLRSKELAIRSSLGASRWRIISQLLTESIVLATVGSIIGLFLSRLAANYLAGFRTTLNMPFWFDFALDGRIFALVAVFTLLTGVVSGLIPALRASKASVNDLLKDDTRTGSSFLLKAFGIFLVVFQVAISCIALICAGLMMKSLNAIVETDMHFDTERVLVARMGLFEGDYPQPEERFQFFTTLKRNLEARPEVQNAALYGRYRWTLTGIDWQRLRHEGFGEVEFEQLPLTTSEFISWDYFETMGIELLEGRGFSEIDSGENAAPVAVVNEALAATLYPDEDPLGKRFQRAFSDEDRASAAERGVPLDETFYTIVGIAPNMAAQGLGNDIDVVDERHFFLPLKAKATATFMTIAVSGPSNPMVLAPLLREEVQKLDPNLPLYALGTVAMIIEEDTGMNRLIASIFKVFGGLAALLAAIGIYGVMSFSVNQRTQEFGIRAALGALPRWILRLVMRAGSAQLAVGLVIGLCAAWFLTKLLQTFLYRVSPSDPMTYVWCALFIALVAAVAMLFPARRASRVHPAQALRDQ